MRRAYKFRIYPTTGQASRMTQCLRDHQRLYNAALEERRAARRMRKAGIRYGQRGSRPWTGGIPPSGRPMATGAAKCGLNKSILDAGWAQFASILAGKRKRLPGASCS